jgi:hypothetical protein
MSNWWSKWRRTLVCGACAATGALTVTAAPPAWGSRAPTATERQKIVAEIKSSEGAAAVRGRFNVRHIRVSTVRTPSVRWGRATIVPKPGVRGDRATVIVGRFGRRWELVDIGTGGAGCWLEKRVRRDLKIGGCT